MLSFVFFYDMLQICDVRSINMSSSSHLAQAVFKAAKRTFARRPLQPKSSWPFGSRRHPKYKFELSPEEQKASLKDLKILLDSLRAQDVGLELSESLDAKAAAFGPPPVTYIQIHEDRDVSMGIFIVKSGCKIPLHNHPMMHGLLKVLCGTVDISVYSKIKHAAGSGLEIPQILKQPDETYLIDQGFVVPTEKQRLKSIDAEYNAILLNPGR